MLEPKWKLGDDLSGDSNILDGFTFNDLLLAVHCNCRVKNEAAVVKCYKEILEQRLEDAMYLLKNNIKELTEAAILGTCEYEVKQND